jgi:hypothetical protein
MQNKNDKTIAEMPVSEIIKCLCSTQYGIDIFFYSQALK